MRNIIIAVTSIIIIIGAWYAVSSRNSSNTPSVSKNTKTNIAKDENKKVFKGEGKKVVGPVKMGKGLILLKAKNQSGINSVFSVNIYADTNGDGIFESSEEYSGFTGRSISVGYEKAEAFDGAIAFKSNGGSYFASIEGGRWQVTFVKPEKLTEQPPAPTSFSGRGIQVTKRFYLPEGEQTFSVTNKGGGNFIIYKIDEDGNFTSRLINEVDDFKGDFTIKNVFDGNYIFSVTGGDWTIIKKE